MVKKMSVIFYIDLVNDTHIYSREIDIWSDACTSLHKVDSFLLPLYL